MAESDPIKLEDFADPAAVPEYKGQWQGVVDTLSQVEAGLIRIAAAMGKTVNSSVLPKTKKEYDDLNESIHKLENTEIHLNDIRRRQIEAQVQANAEIAKYRQQVKDTMAVQDAATDSVTAMRVQLKLLNEEYNKGDAAIRAKLVPTINTLKDKLNETQHAIGNYQNQIGNYALGLGKYGKTLMPLTHVIRGIAAAFGVHLEGLREYASAIHGAIHLNEMATEGEEAHTVAVTESTVATEAGTTATVEQTTANEALAASEGEASMGAAAMGGAIGIAAGALALLVYNVYEYIKAGKDVKEFNKLIAEGEKDLIKLREEAFTAQQKLDIASGKITKEQAEQDNVTIEQQKKTLETTKAYVAELAKLGERPEEKIQGNTGLVYNQKDIDEYDARRKQMEQQTQERLDDIMSAGNDSRAAIQAEADKKALKQVDQYQKEIELLKDEFVKNDLQKDLAKLETERKYALLEVENEENADFKKSEINEIYNLKESLARKKYEEEQEKQREKDIKEYEKYLSELSKRYNKWLEENKKAFEEANKKDNKSIESNAFSALETGKMSTENDIKGDKDPVKKAADEKLLIARQLEIDLAKIDVDELMNAANKEARKVQIKRKAALEIEAIDTKTAEKRIAEEEKMENAIIEAAKQTVTEKSAIQEAGLKTDEEMLASNAQVQATLAAAGKRNSLDAVEAAEAKNAETQKQVQQKEHRAQEALDLASTFEKAVNSNLSAGMSNEQAITKALETTFLAKGIAAGFAAAAGFATGVENLQGPGTGTSDSIPIWASKGESIITAAGTAQNPGLASAVNNGTLEDWFKSNYMPKYISSNGNSDVALTEMTVKEIISGFRKVMNEQPKELAYQVGNKTVIERSKNGLNERKIIESPQWVKVTRD